MLERARIAKPGIAVPRALRADLGRRFSAFTALEYGRNISGQQADLPLARGDPDLSNHAEAEFSRGTESFAQVGHRTQIEPGCHSYHAHPTTRQLTIGSPYRHLDKRIHFWPFDGWEILPGRSAVAEVYPSLWNRGFAREGRSADQHDAYSAGAWTRNADLDGSLAGFLDPSLAPNERAAAQIEGWILGVK